ncbi:putative disease resistance protein RGA3 [Phalaenopsis equestris]|uniref:putative disease resistance protein RGA3 n=1 Tax=Phalaenopsis equestris TaxID=78828 RepID=UPI0009E4A518|nr:putative disease resistance protein RGA3 [Phalaenopsis equestris]
MTLVAHYDMELHKMDVKTAFLNGDIDETIYMVQPENFVSGDSKNMVCKLSKSIYGLKQASRQWYHKFHQVILSFGFEMNAIDDCVYHKFSGRKHIFLILYVDDILLATNDISMLHETKRFLSINFEMKDLGDASFVLGIQIHRDRSQCILGLSQRSYIDKVLKRFGMQNCRPIDTPVAKGDKFSLNQCPKGNLEIQEMQKIPYASAVGSLMYAQVYWKIISCAIYLMDSGTLLLIYGLFLHPKIQAVVSANTRAQIRDPVLNRWIWQLRDAIDEADDVLDDFEYMKLEEQRQDPNLERLETIVKKLDKVSAEVSTFFPLIEKAKQEQQELELQLCEDRKTGCLPQNDFIGRGEEKDFVMQWLRKPTNEDPTHIASPTLYKNISLLSIGMGKTTHLQHIYEDLKEEFELKMWVCVSNHFDAKKIIADMLGFLNKERPRSESLASVQESHKAAVQSKKFLLVLDDIWEEDMSKWENFLCPLTNGSFGSKILITTRMDAVSSVIAKVIKKNMEPLRIKGLEEDACLKLLNTHAFAGDLRWQRRAVKIIGGVLNSNLNESFWMNILNSTDVRNVEIELGHNNILPILRLSFTFLPQPLKNCFAFCGIFPQDHQFDRDDLVRMWIALGFIQESSIEGETLEDIGGSYFDILVIKSFFDKFQDYQRIYHKMHDLLHDLAHCISSEECFGFVGDNILSFKLSKNVRHLFVNTENLEVLTMIKDVKNLHSLFLITKTNDQGFTEILTKIFEASRRIRLLFIDSLWQNKMPEAIKNLRHLRYLNLNANLCRMPRSLSSLYHLKFVICMNFAFASDDFLPGDVSNLSNLRHLELPLIGELEHMSELRELKIHFLENVKDAGEARNAKLFEKRKLTDLFLNWGDDERNSDRGVGNLRNIVNSDLDVNVLENLRPYKNLKSLSLFSYKGVSSAKWMYDADLISNLEHVNLNWCSEWETLPPFGQLPHLKSLYLCNMPKVKQLDNKFSGNNNICVFPALEVLHMEGLQVLEDLFDKAGATSDDCFFPCLKELFLVNCPNLQELRYLPPKFKNMHVEKVGWKAALNCMQGSNNCCSISKSIPLESLEVLSCPNITSLLQADVRLEALRQLRIEGCPNLISLGGLQQVESGIEKFQLFLSEVVIDDPSLLPKVIIASLEKLTICNNDVLLSFTIEVEQWFPHVSSSLRELSFKGLKSLQSLPSSLECLSSLKILRVENVPQLQQLLHIPASLEELHLECLESLQCLPTSLSAISFLKRLWLKSIPLLKSLPDLPFSLYCLDLSSLDNLQDLPSSMSAISSLKHLDLDSIPLLKSLPELPPSLDYNTSVIQITANLVFRDHTKHIEVDYHSIQEAYDNDVISLPHISSDIQTTNIFTKALSRQCHQLFVGKLMLFDLSTSI